jgi:hypothetical protein
VLTNHGRDALVDLALSGDMASAHASRPMDEQLGLAGPELPPLAQIARIEAGASVTVPVEMRLPLAAVLAIARARRNCSCRSRAPHAGRPMRTPAAPNMPMAPS